MGSISITFNGICTFVTPGNGITLPAGVQWRVVLLNASSGRNVNGVLIPPHAASITIQPAGAPADPPIALNGCTLSITPLDPAGFSDPEFDPPNLTNLVASVEPLSVPSSEVVTGGIADFASCYFDITSGTLSSGVNSMGAVFSTLVVSGGDNFTLTMTPFAAAPATNLPPVTTLATGSAVTIANEATNEQDGLDHFLLHYLVATQLPPAPQLPPPRPVPEDLVGAGCSNSQYP